MPAISDRLSIAFLICAATLVACADEASLQEGEWLPGGETTNTFLLGSNAFTMPAENTTSEHQAWFYSGNSFFSQGWVQAPASTTGRDGLGPLFNARACSVCHFKDGRGRPPLEEGEEFKGLLFRLALDQAQTVHGSAPDPVYGGQLQPFAIGDVPPEVTPTLYYEELAGVFDDGEPYTLLNPVYGFTELGYGPLDPKTRVSPRVAQAVIGLGLLEAIPDARLAELEDPDDEDGDGVSGRRNLVWDIEAQQTRTGRFGWKAEQPTIRQQSAAAFLGDLGLTTPLFPEETCSDAQVLCASAENGGEPEVAEKILDRVAHYVRLVAVPMRTRYDDEEVLRGKGHFYDLGCAACHVANHITADDAELVELRSQSIWPYTDLLLHDMGEALADHSPSFEASGTEWRTAPLWGLGYYDAVNGHDRLMHDGRARGVSEAILWHGGEAAPARDAFKALPVTERDALVAFVESL